MRKYALVAIAVIFAALSAAPAFAHPGGLDRNGCHKNHKTDEYHCHRQP